MAEMQAGTSVGRCWDIRCCLHAPTTSLEPVCQAGPRLHWNAPQLESQAGPQLHWNARQLESQAGPRLHWNALQLGSQAGPRLHWNALQLGSQAGPAHPERLPDFVNQAERQRHRSTPEVSRAGQWHSCRSPSSTCFRSRPDRSPPYPLPSQNWCRTT